jgi:glycosyltransferase involved in cell wall biosynthesis
MAATLPFVSVAIRSYRRLPQLLELLGEVLRQAYPRFEVVVIEQSGAEREKHRAALKRISKDPRVRILEYEPLGAGGARNEAARQSRGEVVLFIDDDDLPIGPGWIRAHADNYADPDCVAVSGRLTLDPAEDGARHDTPRNHRLCLCYSWLKMPRGRNLHRTRIAGVTQVAGSNASIRKSAIERAGGWDPEPDHDEDSFNFKFARLKRAEEHFAYDPAALVWRRLDIGGGLGRREQSVYGRFVSELGFSHRVIRRYYPVQFWALYPVYLWLAAARACQHVFTFRKSPAAASATSRRER